MLQTDHIPSWTVVAAAAELFISLFIFEYPIALQKLRRYESPQHWKMKEWLSIASSAWICPCFIPSLWIWCLWMFLTYEPVTPEECPPVKRSGDINPEWRAPTFPSHTSSSPHNRQPSCWSVCSHTSGASRHSCWQAFSCSPAGRKTEEPRWSHRL